MFELETKMKEVLMQYILLKLTYREDGNWSSIDFDDVRGVWDSTLGLEVMPYELSSYGMEIGLLIHYEDELYTIDQTVWEEVHDALDVFLSNFNILHL